MNRQRHDLIPNSPEHHAFRATHTGASEAAAMLGLSKHTTRDELLWMKKTGAAKEFSEWVRKNVLDHGHEVEAKALPIVEVLLGETLRPAVYSMGTLSASCDGINFDDSVVFEHKQWSRSLADSVRSGVLPEEHMPQCQQQLLVTGADRVVFVVSDGTREHMLFMDVLPDPVWFERIQAGWVQFDKDKPNAVPPTKVATIAETVQSLPTVFVQITGQIAIQDNLKEFEVALREFLDHQLIREPQTDQDFADLDAQIKEMKRAEKALDSSEAQMIAQVQSIDAAKRHKDMLSRLVRDNRLMAEKLMESEKSRRKSEKIEAARKAFTDHTDKLQAEIKWVRINFPLPDFSFAIKGLKTMDSVQDKLDVALANGKIAADAMAADVRMKLAWLKVHTDEDDDLQLTEQLFAKPFEDFKLVVMAKLEAQKKAMEAERAKIREEEVAKLRAEQPVVAIPTVRSVAVDIPELPNGLSVYAETPVRPSGQPITCPGCLQRDAIIAELRSKL